MATQLRIVMADNEYDGNCPMIELANEQFAKHADTPDLMVMVVEHGGWWLSFGKVDGKTVVVETANDTAKPTDECRRFWDRVKGADWNNLPTIHRV